MLDLAQNSTIESLLRTAGGTPEELERLVDELTLANVVPVLLEEITERCFVPHEVIATVLLEVYRGDDSIEHTLSFDGGKLSVTRGRDGDPGARVRFEAVDLVTALYGPPGRPGGLTRQVESLLRLPGRGTREDTFELFLAQRAFAEAVAAILAACGRAPLDLNELSVRFDSDKWGFLHWFTEHYTVHFRDLVEQPVRLLEIGVGGYSDPAAGGGSLRMWQRYFRRGLIYGLDVYDKSAIRGPRMRTIRGDQNDPEFLREMGERIGPFDIIIDDGSHVNEHVLTSFDALFPYLRPGGLYVIEDLDTTYWPGFGGAVPGEATGTIMERIKELIDGIHYPEYQDTSAYQPSLTERSISGVHSYRNIVFIDKGLNMEGEPPSWIPRHPV